MFVGQKLDELRWPADKQTTFHLNVKCIFWEREFAWTKTKGGLCFLYIQGQICHLDCSTHIYVVNIIGKLERLWLIILPIFHFFLQKQQRYKGDAKQKNMKKKNPPTNADQQLSPSASMRAASCQFVFLCMQTPLHYRAS